MKFMRYIFYSHVKKTGCVQQLSPTLLVNSTCIGMILYLMFPWPSYCLIYHSVWSVSKIIPIVLLTSVPGREQNKRLSCLQNNSEDCRVV